MKIAAKIVGTILAGLVAYEGALIARAKWGHG